MKRSVAFVFGGMSVEHEISIITGLQAYHAFENDAWEPFPLYISKRGEMYVGDALTQIENYKDLNKVLSASKRVILVNEGRTSKLVEYPQKRFGKSFEQEIDMAFLCVHGTNVEDGALQGYFKTLNVPIVGCDVESAALGMDKYTQKAVLENAGIPLLPAKRYTSKDYLDLDILTNDVKDTFSFPVIVKPVNLGSSVGINIANNEEELVSALDDAFMYSSQVLVERAISNLREINCSVLGDIEECEASEIEEPVGSDEILSYEDKYMSNQKGGSKGMASVSRKIPAEVSGERREEIRELSCRAFKALGCNGVARLDFMIDKDTDEVFFNEINTIPGSLSFYLWEPLGISYKVLLNKMLELAVKRQRVTRSLTYSFNTNVLNSATLQGSKGK